MSPTIRKCKQCGELKPMEQFRKYYNSSTNEGRYRTCLLCEKINNREKYLSRRPSITESQQEELDQIHELYEVLRQQGLRPPGKKDNDAGSLKSSVAELLAKKRFTPPVPTEIVDIPEELQAWLSKEFNGEDPDDLQEQVDELYERYMPVLRLDEKMEPVRDERYREHLNKIQEALDVYEQEYWN